MAQFFYILEVMKRRRWADGIISVALMQEIVRALRPTAINDPLGILNLSNPSLSALLLRCSVRGLIKLLYERFQQTLILHKRFMKFNRFYLYVHFYKKKTVISLAMSVSHLCDKYSASSSFKMIKADLGNLRIHLETLSVII